MQLTGILHVKKDTQKVSESFQKRDFVIKIEDAEYPQYISLQVKQDKCNALDYYNEGDKIEVHFNINGRRWEKDGEVKYFNSLDAWKIIKVSGENTKRSQEASAPATEEQDDSPF